MVVYFTISGTAGTNDYEPLGNSVTLPAGITSTDVLVKPVNDSELEGHESVVATGLSVKNPDLIARAVEEQVG